MVGFSWANDYFSIVFAHKTKNKQLMRFLIILLCVWLTPILTSAQSQTKLSIQPNDHIVFIGNTFAERMQHFGYFETLFHLQYPDSKLQFRNMGWSADEPQLQPRPLNFGAQNEHLTNAQVDVIFLCFGMNESFQGADGLTNYIQNLQTRIRNLKSQRFNGKTAPRLVLVSPIAHEQLAKLRLDPTIHNQQLQQYTASMKQLAIEENITFINLFDESQKLFSADQKNYTINGIHLTDEGYQKVAMMMMNELQLANQEATNWENLQALRELIVEKNRQFFFRWRPVNSEYIFGRRKEPFGVENFPGEMEMIDQILEGLDQQIWSTVSALKS
jgi:hypothetical protein